MGGVCKKKKKTKKQPAPHSVCGAERGWAGLGLRVTGSDQSLCRGKLMKQLRFIKGLAEKRLLQGLGSALSGGGYGAPLMARGEP